ncbi:MAG: hypothetical protein HKP48_07885 [Winogradskyella sp.]|uniref:hypothetical protein n=1 Tax=Winogradskyella sp. TaxID=1883156 RepID=UPI0017F174A3|nr:hypothetical protein [Winogradskyella sp.]MBT8245742.1 hypothetical protein [Winogradskyella sp.]NNK23201.1 hypothetical protein [Winogradskyella sp.]
MKKISVLLIIFVLLGCKRQDKETEVQELDRHEIVKDHTAVKPKEHWDVHKEYDEFGNLVKYDSIYSWSYSNVNGDSIRINLDSIMDSFRIYFGNQSPYKLKEEFFFFPKSDSLFMNDFFEDYYFYKNWQKQYSEIEVIIKKMDSSRNRFIKKFHPGLLESKEKN